MKKLLISVWRDPVGSKLISAIIIAISLWVWALFQGVSWMSVINNILNYPVKLSQVFSLIVIWWIVRFIYRKNKGLSRKQRDISIFQTLRFESQNLDTKWIVRFDKNGNPYPTDIVSYCTEHDVPLKLYQGKCQGGECDNSFHGYYYDPYLVKNQVESYLTHEWNRIHNRT